jgi:hypothetical protein
MADAIGSFLNFDAGISRVVWDAPAGGALPDRGRAPPSGLGAVLQLDRLLRVDNLDAVIARAMEPAIASADLRRPDRFEDAMQAAGTLVEKAAAEASGEARQALQGLANVLKEHTDLQSTLHYYREMLIAG